MHVRSIPGSSKIWLFKFLHTILINILKINDFNKYRNKSKTPACAGVLPVVTETNKLQLHRFGQKYATINCKASAIFVSVGTTISLLQRIGSPVYTTHSASNTSEQVKGDGHPAGVGHGAGDTRALSEHPHFLHPQVVQVL
jgi:hypothetical protein